MNNTRNLHKMPEYYSIFTEVTMWSTLVIKLYKERLNITFLHLFGDSYWNLKINEFKKSHIDFSMYQNHRAIFTWKWNVIG